MGKYGKLEWENGKVWQIPGRSSQSSNSISPLFRFPSHPGYIPIRLNSVILQRILLTKSGEVLRAKGYGNTNLRMWYRRIKEMLLQLDLLGFTAGSYVGMAL